MWKWSYEITSFFEASHARCKSKHRVSFFVLNRKLKNKRDFTHGIFIQKIIINWELIMPKVRFFGRTEISSKQKLVSNVLTKFSSFKPNST